MVVLTLTAALVCVGGWSARADTPSTTIAPQTTITPQYLPVPAAPAAAPTSRLSSFDAALLQMINSRRAAAKMSSLIEVVGLDAVSASWSTSVLTLGRYGKLGVNTSVAAQAAASGIPSGSAAAQSSAKWYPQTVKVADVFKMYTGYPDAMSKMLNRSSKYIGIRTVRAADGTSVASLTYATAANASQIVNPATAHNPVGAITSALQVGATVKLHGRAADVDSPTVRVAITDSVGTTVVSAVAVANGGEFDATVGLTGAGVHKLCAKVVNQGPGSDLPLGCTAARIGSMMGHADTLRQTGSTVLLTGWGFDQAAPRASIAVKLTISGPTGTRVVTVLARGNRPDVARAYPAAGSGHGFRVNLPTMGRGVTTVCTTILPAQPTSVARKLACRTLTVS